MIRRIIGVFGTGSLMVILMSYMYVKGGQDGVARYKRSKQFSYALMGAYAYGLWDGCNNDKTQMCPDIPKAEPR